jgi:cobalt/nickel transport system permease protein
MGSGHVHEAPLASGRLGQLEARAKLLVVLPAIVLVNVVPVARWPVPVACAALFVGLAAAGGRGGLGLLRRALPLVPFALFVALTLPFSLAGRPVFTLHLGVVDLTASAEGLARAGEALVRAGTSIAGLLVLSGTTVPTDLFQGLIALRVPRAFVLVLALVHRYLFLVGNELSRLVRGARARGFRLRDARAVPRLGTMAGALLARSVARSERVHHAMLARGFDGELRAFAGRRFGRPEAVFLVLCYAVLALGLMAAFHDG